MRYVPAGSERPPASTEQVLHPGRRRELFLAFDLRGVREELPAGCAFVYENTVGELLLSVLFGDLGDRVPATAWEGWDGDRYLAAECDGKLELLWVSAWDSPEDAAEFESAYSGIGAAVAARAGFAAPPRPTRAGREVVVSTRGLAGLVPRLAALVLRHRVGEVEALRSQFIERGAPEPPAARNPSTDPP